MFLVICQNDNYQKNKIYQVKYIHIIYIKYIIRLEKRIIQRNLLIDVLILNEIQKFKTRLYFAVDMVHDKVDSHLINDIAKPLFHLVVLTNLFLETKKGKEK